MWWKLNLIIEQPLPTDPDPAPHSLNKNVDAVTLITTFMLTVLTMNVIVVAVMDT